MAEIDLPPNDDISRTSAPAEKDSSNSPTWNNSTSTSWPDSASDKIGHAASPSVALDKEAPIVYHYLTFETLLPRPPSPDAPLPPDLKKYTSPFDWPNSRKSFTIWLSTIATLVTAYNAGSYSPAAAQLQSEWHVSEVAVLVGITTFCCGFGIAPMVLAPFSEINGRYPVFVCSGVLFVVCEICCAVTRSYAGMLLARLFVGVGSSVFSTMVGGVVADLYVAEERNTPMAIFSGGVLFGTGLGPLVSGFIAQNTDWRWIFWVQVITCGLTVLAVALFFKETRGSILLSRKARALNAYYELLESHGHFGFEMPSPTNDQPLPNPEKPSKSLQRIRWKVKSDEERESLTKMISISVYRPFMLLVTEPVVFFFSLWVAFSWAVLYLTFGAVTLVFSRSHAFNLQQANAVFAAMCVGGTLSTILSIYQDRLLARFLEKKGGRIARSIDLTSPEGRLYFACLESALLPIGLFWFGWTQFPSIPWIVPTLAISCATMGIYSIYLATFNYFADTYGRYASSALAAQSFCRNILGGVFPLVTAALFNNLTFQGAASLLGGLAALLTCVPWVLVFYGPTIRARSKFAMDLA